MTNISAILSQIKGGEALEKLLDLAQSPEERWRQLQIMIKQSPIWRKRINDCLVARKHGTPDSEILNQFIDSLGLNVGGWKINAMFLRSTLSVEQVRKYEDGFSQILTLYSERKALASGAEER